MITLCINDNVHFNDKIAWKTQKKKYPKRNLKCK